MKRISLALPTFPNPSAAKPRIGELWLWIRVLVADHGCAKLSVSVRQCVIAEANTIASVERVMLARLKKSLSWRHDRTTSLMPSLMFGILLLRYLKHVTLSTHSTVPATVTKPQSIHGFVLNILNMPKLFHHEGILGHLAYFSQTFGNSSFVFCGNTATHFPLPGKE